MDAARGRSRAQISVRVIGIGFAKGSYEAKSVWMPVALRGRIGIRMDIASAPQAQAKIFHKDRGLCQPKQEREQDRDQER
jgi:hypothetical protein